MAIFTQMGVEVEITSEPEMDLLDPTTMHPMMQYVEVRSKDGDVWKRRICELKADGGIQEIQEALSKKAAQ